MAINPRYLGEAHNGWNGTLIANSLSKAYSAPGAASLIVVFVSIIHSNQDPFSGAGVASGASLSWTKVGQSTPTVGSQYEACSGCWVATTTTDPGSWTFGLTINGGGHADGYYKTSAYAVTSSELDGTTPYFGFAANIGVTGAGSGNGPRTLTLGGTPAAGDVILAQAMTDENSVASACVFDVGSGGTWTTNYPVSPQPNDGLNSGSNNGYVTGRTTTALPWSDMNDPGTDSWGSTQVALILKSSAAAPSGAGPLIVPRRYRDPRYRR